MFLYIEKMITKFKIFESKIDKTKTVIDFIKTTIKGTEWDEYEEEDEIDDEYFHVGDTVIYHYPGGSQFLNVDTIKVIDGQTGKIEKIGQRFHFVSIMGRAFWLPIKDLIKV